MNIDRTGKVVAIIRDIVIIVGVLAFSYWWLFVPSEYYDDYYFEPEEIPENATMDA